VQGEAGRTFNPHTYSPLSLTLLLSLTRLSCHRLRRHSSGVSADQGLSRPSERCRPRAHHRHQHCDHGPRIDVQAPAVCLIWRLARSCTCHCACVRVCACACVCAVKDEIRKCHVEASERVGAHCCSAAG
jgi:hypothetical protein